MEDDHREVVILAHSYGGVVGGAAAKGLDKPTRTAQGQPGGVIGLVYVAGNITLEGECLLEAVGGVYPPFIKENKVSDAILSKRLHHVWGSSQLLVCIDHSFIDILLCSLQMVSP